MLIIPCLIYFLMRLISLEQNNNNNNDNRYYQSLIGLICCIFHIAYCSANINTIFFVRAHRLLLGDHPLRNKLHGNLFCFDVLLSIFILSLAMYH